MTLMIPTALMITIALMLSLSLVVAECIQPVSNCNSSTNYFPNIPNFLYSKTVAKVESKNTWVSVEMEYGDPKVKQSYALVQCGCPAPEMADTLIFYVPVARVMVQDPVTVPKISLIGQTYGIKAVEDISVISSQTLRSSVRFGISSDIKFDYSMINNSTMPDIIFTKPGIMMANSGSGQNPTWYNQSYTLDFEKRRFMETDPFETTPLGRAELIKLYGLIFGVVETSESIFSAINQNYLAAKTSALSYSLSRASVIRGFPKDGNWQVLSKSSYLSLLLKDAGAEFLDADIFTTPNLPTSVFKDFFSQSSFWIDAYGDMKSSHYEFDLFKGNQSKAVGGDDQYFSDFVSVECDRIYSNGAQVNGYGNPLYESGVLRPDLVLWDLVQILHPDSFPMPNLHYYEHANDDSDRPYAKNCPLAKVPASPSREYVFIDRRFVISGVYPALYQNVIPSFVKPRLEALTGTRSEDLTVFIMNSDRSEEMKFDVQVRIYTPVGNITKYASSLENADPILDILAGSYVLFLNADSVRSSLSYMKQVPSNLKVEIVNDVTITNADGSKSSWTSGTTFSTGTIVGIVIGVVVFTIILAYLASRIGFSRGKEYAYQKLEEEKGGMENVKSIDTLVADFENADEEGDFVEMHPRTSSGSVLI